MIDYRGLLDELAVPRLVGSPNHARVRECLKRELRTRGYVTLEHPFPVRPPGRLVGPMYLGAGLLWAALTLLGSVVRWPVAATLATSLVAGVVVGLVARGRRAPPVTGINLIAVRPLQQVGVWLCAHYDSKGQPMSMLMRIGAVGLALAGAVGLGVVGLARVAGAAWAGPAAGVLLGPALVGGGMLLQNHATNDSPGGLDNGSALITVLAIVDRLPGTASVGVLFTDAEEYGLLGASALVRERGNLLAGTAVVNLDGIDDRGPTRCVIHRAGPWSRAVRASLGVRRAGRLPVVVDGWALRSAAAECLTIMRGDWRTAAIVHTPHDTAARLTLTGASLVAAAVAAALDAPLAAARVDAPNRGL